MITGSCTFGGRILPVRTAAPAARGEGVKMTVRPARFLGRLSLMACFATGAVTGVAAQEPLAVKKDETKKPEKLGPVVTSDRTLNLHECLAVALERQPNIKASLATLRATEVGGRSLSNLSRLARLFTPDLCYRQQQAAKGLTTAQADILKVQYETIYDVTRLYYTFIYARQQEATATDIIDQMETYLDIARDLVKQGVDPANLNQVTLFRMEDAIAEIKKPRITARNGQLLALAALKEAMGVEQAFSFVPRDTELPIMGGDVTQEQVTGFAMSRRPELTLAAAGLDAFRLEVCAQASHTRRQRVATLASGADLHARFVPGPVRNGEYRPGALAPELPVYLVGSREDRVARAVEFSSRQETVLEKTQNLVELEATNSYLIWKSSVERFDLAKNRFDGAQRVLKTIRANAANIKYDQLILNEALAAKSQAEYLEAAFENIKALATLERVTTGGIRPNFPQK